MAAPRVIDAHLHVWSPAGKELAWPAPPGLQGEQAAPEVLTDLMTENGVDGAVIVQPINYEYDHSFVASVLESDRAKFRGVLLANPALKPKKLAEQVRALAAPESGVSPWTGVRLNPYLWPNCDEPTDDEWIADAAGKALFDVCADLALPIGVMAFEGFTEDLRDRLDRLVAHRPDAIVVLDHFGFPREDPSRPPSPELTFDDEAFARVVDFGRRHEYAHLKLSALFRASREAPPYDDLRPKVAELVDAYGTRRLLWGSDFPFVTLQDGGYKATRDAVAAWFAVEEEDSSGGEEDVLAAALRRDAARQPLGDDLAANVLGANAARLYRFDDYDEEEGASEAAAPVKDEEEEEASEKGV